MASKTLAKEENNHPFTIHARSMEENQIHLIKKAKFTTTKLQFLVPLIRIRKFKKAAKLFSQFIQDGLDHNK